MTDASLSATSAQDILDDIQRREAANARSAKRHFAAAAAGAIGYLALTLTLPVTGWIALPAWGAAAVGVIGFNRLMQDWGRDRTLSGLRQEVKEDTFTGKLAKRVERVSKNFLRARNAFDALFLGTTALLFGALLFAEAVPATAIAAGYVAAQAAFAAYQWVTGAKYAACAVARQAGVAMEEKPKKKAARAVKPAPAPAPETPAPLAVTPVPAFTAAAAKEPAPPEKPVPAPEPTKPAAPQP